MSDKLILKTINELLGENFYIPHYQRGYRWTEKQVKDLLNDIWSFTNQKRTGEYEFYCLQPIVIKTKTWDEDGDEIKGWEVIDGQQRLTTIYIILTYLAKEFMKVENLKDDYGKSLFTIRYETRPGSAEFLRDLKNDYSNIDFYFMSKAYETAKQWFTCGDNVKDRSDREKFLSTILGRADHGSSVQVIWYHVEQSVDSLDLFTRLNIGKIPLTNSELIKALFLSNSSFDNDEDGNKKKLEISLLWDEMEQRLNDEDFWAFLTNQSQMLYSNKIELLFDMISDRNETEVDPLYTFLHFLNKVKTSDTSLWEIWLMIERYYQTACEWFKNKNLYHKIGYLISIGENLKSLIEKSLESRKDVFEDRIDNLIRESVKFDIDDLTYDSNQGYRNIERILLLFNIESIRGNQCINEFYPFKFHKSVNWSLEHIHAQNSEGLDKTKKDPWLKWLKYHKSLIGDLIQEINDSERFNLFSALLHEIEELDRDRITWEKFSDLSMRISEQFTEISDKKNEDIHGVSNLALLSQHDNSALNNSVFEVKRRELIEMDKRGSYIPICTRRVFLKYYNPKPASEHYYFWSAEDRQNYLNEIKSVLENYLPQSEITEA